MSATQEQIEKLKTLQESYDVLTDAVENQLPALADKIDNIDLTPIENKVDEGVSTLSTKIDNIDLSSVAKQGSNQDATMTAVLEEIQSFANRNAKYDSTTGNLTIENVNITIE